MEINWLYSELFVDLGADPNMSEINAESIACQQKKIQEAKTKTAVL